MQNTASCRHPLTAAIQNTAFISQTVSMFYITFYQVGHRFNTAMWMPWETFDIITWVLGIKSIKHQKRVKIIHSGMAYYTNQFNSCSIILRAACYNFSDCSQPDNSSLGFVIPLFQHLP